MHFHIPVFFFALYLLFCVEKQKWGRTANTVSPKSEVAPFVARNAAPFVAAKSFQCFAAFEKKFLH